MLVLTINIHMNYDNIVNQILQEAYFSNAYEKATGIKRQIEATSLKPPAKSESEFRGTKNRKLSAMHLAIQKAVMAWEATSDAGQGFPDIVDEKTGRTKRDPEGKNWLLDKWIEYLLDNESGTSPGDAFTEDDFNRGLHALGHATGISGEETGAQLKYHKKRKWGPGMEGEDPNSISDAEPRFKPIISLPGFMAKLKKAEDKVKTEIRGNKMSSRDADMEEDPERLADARKRLRASLDASRRREVYR